MLKWSYHCWKALLYNKLSQNYSIKQYQFWGLFWVKFWSQIRKLIHNNNRVSLILWMAISKVMHSLRWFLSRLVKKWTKSDLENLSRFTLPWWIFWTLLGKTSKSLLWKLSLPFSLKVFWYIQITTKEKQFKCYGLY